MKRKINKFISIPIHIIIHEQEEIANKIEIIYKGNKIQK